MKILYIANARMPTEKAHGIQIAKMCEALAKFGHRAELVVPKRRNYIKKNFFDYYGLEKPSGLKIKFLWSLDLVWLPLPSFLKKIAFWKQSATFAFFARWYARKRREALFYTRDLLLAMVLPAGRLFYEIHWLPDRVQRYHLLAYKRAAGIIVISDKIKNELSELGIAKDKILVARDGVDAAIFDTNSSEKECREQLGLPLDKKIILYTGHLYGWKGAETLLKAAREFTDDFLFLFVGGTDEDVKAFRDKVKNMNLKNAEVTGHKPYRQIPIYMRAADVLVLPNSAEQSISKKYTSPLKMFEYMMSGRPIVASDLPSIREVLDEETAQMVLPDEPKVLAVGIKAVIHNPELSKQRALAAHDKALEYTWENRAKIILTFINR